MRGSNAFRLSILAGGLALAAPALAVQTTFATFTPTSAQRNVRLVNNGTGNPANASSGTSAQLYSTADGSSTSKGLASTRFSFLGGAIASYVSALPAWFELDATVTNRPADVVSGAGTQFYVQNDVNGYFQFTTVDALVVGATTYAAGTVLLRGDFTLAQLAGQAGATNAGFGDTLTGTLSYSSPFLDFSAVNDSDFQMSFNSIAAALSVAGDGSLGNPYKALRSFRGTASGNFGSDPAPAVSAVPEPESWGLMIAGFVMIGLQSRFRARTRAISA